MSLVSPVSLASLVRHGAREGIGTVHGRTYRLSRIRRHIDTSHREEGIMIGTLTPEGTTALFNNPPAPGFTLWFRSNASRSGWEPVGQYETQFEAVNAIGIGNRHAGKWCVLPAGREP